ncbi:helicase mug81 [Pseudozyma hubeiensis SY62]|uniref:Helicase mug81 n=1 Tax=Pseudozyma hubeiensis (strain SY62) TaxID=1305764 RepID=R9P7A4_PSEHS|nr:helicase mug81 [Pseudozyma hubeiensis SY62]GAC97219.1 helicase mug81 [Pseudozyma hubeiensis SY62]
MHKPVWDLCSENEECDFAESQGWALPSATKPNAHFWCALMSNQRIRATTTAVRRHRLQPRLQRIERRSPALGLQYTEARTRRTQLVALRRSSRNRRHRMIAESGQMTNSASPNFL